MRYYIIFGITLILLLIILFVNPYLGVYKGEVTIEYNYDLENYSWKYDIKGEALKLKESSDNKWTFEIHCSKRFYKRVFLKLFYAPKLIIGKFLPFINSKKGYENMHYDIDNIRLILAI